MIKISKDQILKKAKELYAKGGYEEFSIRKLAKSIPISHSVIYHYFQDEELLLKEMFDYASEELGRKRHALAKLESPYDMLKQRIEFQIDNAEDIVAVLKYYIWHRPQFEKFKNGFVPPKSALHIEEVLEYGVKKNEFYVKDIEDDAKVITHAINGFLLEYYPYKPKGKEKQELIDRIYTFIIRSLKGGE